MNSLVRVMLKYGLIAGVIGFLLVLGLYFIGRHPFLIPPFFDFRIIFFGIFIFFALKEFRDYHQDGVLYFWQGLIGSFLFTLTFALTASTAIYIFIQFVPDFLKSYVELSIAQLKSLPEDTIKVIGKDIYQRNLDGLPSTDAYDLAKLHFGQSIMIGTFVSIILSVVTRRQPKT